MRGLVMDFPNDQKVKGIADQYMFGPSLLINPVTQFKATERSLYLPGGFGWYDLYTGKYFRGGTTIEAKAPLERMPVFVKAGAIIPTGPELQYTSEKPADPLTVFIYTGANGTFALYEDEGTNYNYEQGKSSLIPIQYDDSAHTVTVGKRQGEFSGMLQKRNIQFVWVSKDKPVGMVPTAHPAAVIDYTGEPQTVSFDE